MSLDPAQAYQMLGLTPDASPEEVKVAYRDLAKVWHPDRFLGDERLRTKALENFKRINEAYAVLRDYRAPRILVPAGAAYPTPTAPIVAPHSDRPPASTARPAPSPPGAARDQRHSMFTGMAVVRQSLKVLWPSATYLRRRRRRLIPPAWIVIALVALGLALLGVLSLWYEGFLDF